MGWAGWVSYLHRFIDVSWVENKGTIYRWTVMMNNWKTKKDLGSDVFWVKMLNMYFRYMIYIYIYIRMIIFLDLVRFACGRCGIGCVLLFTMGFNWCVVNSCTRVCGDFIAGCIWDQATCFEARCLYPITLNGAGVLICAVNLHKWCQVD